MVRGSGDGGEDEIRRVFFNSGQMKHLAATQIVLLGCFFFNKVKTAALDLLLWLQSVVSYLL